MNETDTDRANPAAEGQQAQTAHNDAPSQAAPTAGSGTEGQAAEAGAAQGPASATAAASASSVAAAGQAAMAASSAAPADSNGADAAASPAAGGGNGASDHAGGNGRGMGGARQAGAGLDLVMRIPVTVEIVLGTVRMTIAELMRLGPGSFVQLDRHVGEPVDVMVNGKLVARGEVVVSEEDESRLGIRLTEIVEPGAMC
ncbi:flagellar motor switch protein FliN [Thermopetrobacter sp. TC1]|uniref:flagellar motor switch protein FliN n=1 Tax=Thermopetrobacter sp. TC1 TaxID=1495045 RepID=UPI000A7276B3|nr:flagellar motor switch protein FliN [Thermopetrobacter sp. TC1]